MEQRKVVTGVVGAGAISGIYLKNMTQRFDNLSVKSISSAHMESAVKRAGEYGIRAVAQVLKKVNSYSDNSRGIGPWDMADTILNGTPLRASGEMACHVHEVLAVMLEGGTAGAFRDISSVCQRPEPLVEG